MLRALAWLLAFSTLCASAQQATLVGDAHVSSLRPTVNAGSLSNLDVGDGSTALVQFDLSTLPPGTTAAQITRATLRVYCNRADTPGPVSVQTVGSAWTESTVTYATMPTLGAALQTTQASAPGQFLTFDVTAAVQGWINAPATNNGLALSSSTAVVQFDSKENDQTAHPAELDIALAAGGAVSVGPSGATGATGAIGPAGVTGPQGIQGPQGLAGVPGLQGLPGATGSPGPMGATGPAGALGLPGATGATGAAGATGATGFGLQGVAGSTGATGTQGAAGATGSPGLVYQGTYSSTTNYTLGDVVIFAGSSYASLTTSNHGNTPGLSPLDWGQLTAQGPIGLTGASGPTGATGSQGLPGSVGPPGEQGNQGAQGVAGQAGAQGIPGTTGAIGLQGPMGPQGVAGPVGLSFIGAYDSTVNYALGNGVLWQGEGWVSLTDNNHGNTPSLSPSDWAMFAASGATGATGATGADGQPGAAGLNGLNGATGATGATGVAGVTGTPGLVYQGAYSSTTNYALGDVVLYGGSSYTSLTASNSGNTPSLSPGSWGVLTSTGPAGPVGATGLAGATGPQGLQGLVGAQGSAGPQGVEGPEGPAGAQGLAGANGVQGAQGPIGPQGIAGEAGAQGIPGTTGASGAQGPAGPEGATGATGSSGAAGATGAAGSPGLVYQGAYDSTINYALGDVVVYGGSSYASLTASNQGNTPGISPAAWGVLTSIGPAGPAGPIGPSGATGSQGLQGLVGPQGSAGVQGVAGPEGPAGAQGLTGANGVQGAQGPTGPQGVAGQAGAQGIAGSTGATGAQGPAGAQGVAGATGATGAAGSNGSDGAPGLAWQGAWSSVTNYAANDAVSYGGASYISLASGNQGQAPSSSPTYWAVLSAAGAAGDAGTTGATGPQGAAGAQGAAGVTGATGASGATGAVGLNFRGAWTQATNYAVNDAVTFAGSTYLALAAGSNQEPDVSPQAWTVLAQEGGAGPTGAAGAAATVSVGSVTTLAAGSSATVTNTGTAQEAVLNFGIPQGVAGANGTSGGTGSTGSGSFAAMYHPVSYTTTYYAVNSPNASASESAAVLAWVPLGCTATRLDVYSQQSGTITVTLRSGTASALAATALSCTPSGGSCTSLGSVAVPAGDFLDFEIDGASGTTAGVWTSLQCN